jgi:hypothetical protein
MDSWIAGCDPAHTPKALQIRRESSRVEGFVSPADKIRGYGMRVKSVLADVKLVVADIEVTFNGQLRSSPTLCAMVAGGNDGAERVIPLNTPDGRPILMDWANAIAAPGT